MKRLVAGRALALILLAGAAWGDVGLDVYVSEGLYSNYVFRGFRVAPVSLFSYAGANYNIRDNLSVQGSALSYTLLTAGTPTSKIGVAEIDTDVSMTWRPWPVVGVTAGWVYYSLSGAYFAAPDSGEVYLGLDFDLPGNPSITGYYSYDKAVGGYITASAGEVWTLGDSGWFAETSGAISFRPNSLVGFAGTISGFNDAVIHTALRYNLGSGWTIGPSVDWWFMPSTVDPGAADHFRAVGGLRLDYYKRF